MRCSVVHEGTGLAKARRVAKMAGGLHICVSPAAADWPFHPKIADNIAAVMGMVLVLVS